MAYLHHGWTSEIGVFIVTEGNAPSHLRCRLYKNAVRQTCTHWKCVIKTCIVMEDVLPLHYAKAGQRRNNTVECCLQ